MAGEVCNPHGITSTGDGQVIIADGDNCRLLVLDAMNGEPINAQDLMECHVAIQPHLIKNDRELVLFYRYHEKEWIAHYDID